MDEDKKAKFEGLYRYYPSVVSYFRRTGFSREDAQELAQDVFVRVYAGMDAYRGESKLAFLLTIARRLGINAIRDKNAAKRRGQTESDDSLMNRPDPRIKSPTTKIHKAEKRRRVQEAIAKLPEQDRKLLTLQLNGETNVDIGKTCGLSESAVKSRLFKARQELRKLLGPDSEWLVTDVE